MQCLVKVTSLRLQFDVTHFTPMSLRKKSEYGEVLCIFPHSVQMREKQTRKTPNQTLFTQCVFQGFLTIAGGIEMEHWREMS